MHLAILEYEPKRRLVLRTPRLQRNVGLAFLLLTTGMVLFVPFAAGVMFIVSRHTDFFSATQEQVIIVAGAVLSFPYAAGIFVNGFLGYWLCRRRRTVEIDTEGGHVVERERYLRAERMQRHALAELDHAECLTRLRSAGEGRRGGGSLTSFAVNLIFRDGTVVNFESLDSRLPAMLEQVVPVVRRE